MPRESEVQQVDSDEVRQPTCHHIGHLRKQAPVVSAHLLGVMNGRSPRRRYDGCTSCPLATARDRSLPSWMTS
ncbi:hypothetical protein ACFVHS_43670 [Streptomyces sp. NPDC057746]|uniref:hypothetical protein n=1 Tax=Streptomyces sp. NPDC057746 TaxID=3346237 RepID=UPI00367DB120